MRDLLHISNALAQILKQGFSRLLAILVEFNALNMSSAGDTPLHQSTDNIPSANGTADTGIPLWSRPNDTLILISGELVV